MTCVGYTANAGIQKQHLFSKLQYLKTYQK